MDEAYRYLYEQYSKVYINHYFDGEQWITILALAVANHKQIDKILQACDADEDEEVILEAMHSCIGCSGISVPSLEG